MTKFKAAVKDKQTGVSSIIEGVYPTKQAFIFDLRRNGYSVNNYKVKEAKVFDWIMENTNCELWDWKEN